MQSLNFAGTRYLFTDVDDTLTTAGQLLPETYQALWDLANAGVQIIPVTGGCAGWCDQIARTWPVAGVIGEGGGFYIVRDRHNATEWRYWYDPAQHRADQQAILDAVHSMDVDFPVALAKDQSFRHVDVAIDYNQDVRLTQDQVNLLCRALIKKGFSVKKSSIHINVWRGAFDKCAMARRYLEDVCQLSAHEMKAQSFFVGDAPNDESMFAFFPNNAAVANIEPHLSQMQSHPATITRQRSGLGFVELADQWLAQLSDHALADS